MSPVLYVTHLAAFLTGAATVYLLFKRYVRVCEVHGHTALEFVPEHELHEETGEPVTDTQTPPDEDTPAEYGDSTTEKIQRSARSSTVIILTIIACVVVMLIGIQALLEAREARDDRRLDKARDARDKEYADCLTTWSSDLVKALDRRATANMRTDAARERKDNALDVLLALSAEAQATGAQTQAELDPELVERYEAALDRRIATQDRYQEIKRQARETRRENPLTLPEAVCQR